MTLYFVTLFAKLSLFLNSLRDSLISESSHTEISEAFVLFDLGQPLHYFENRHKILVSPPLLNMVKSVVAVGKERINSHYMAIKSTHMYTLTLPHALYHPKSVPCTS